MTKFIINRLAALVPILLGTALVVFFMIHLTPGDPARAMLADAMVSGEIYEQLREELGLNEPLLVQLGSFLGGLLRGDLGTSYFTKRPVLTEITARIPITATLMGLSMLIAITIGIPLGIIAATRFGRTLDYAVMAAATFGVSMPGFWVGLMLILLLGVNLGWLPVAGVGGIEYFIMPAIALGTSSAAVLARLTRSSMLQALGADYVRTARAKGVHGSGVVLRHALRNAFIPVLTVIGLQIGSLLTGSIVIETVFALPGLGRLLVQGVSGRDYPLVQGITLLAAVLYVFVNFLVDLAYGLVNPRIRYGS